jgi:four helix bundle protein
VFSITPSSIANASQTYKDDNRRTYERLSDVRKEFVMSKQMLFSGTNVGAHVKGAQEAESRAGFFVEMNAALQHASKCEFWLQLLHDGEFLEDKEFNSIHADCVELIKLTKKITTPTRH